MVSSLYLSEAFGKMANRLEAVTLKKELRQRTLARLQELAASDKKILREEEILAELFDSSLWANAQTVATILPLPLEFDTEKVLRQGWQEGKRMVTPKSLPERKLAFHETTADTERIVTNFGVFEPAIEALVEKKEIDLILVPGLVFRHDGYRIGFGGGFYDRYLADFQGQTASLVFSEQMDEDWQPQAFDIPVARLFIG